MFIFDLIIHYFFRLDFQKGASCSLPILTFSYSKQRNQNPGLTLFCGWKSFFPIVKKVSDSFFRLREEQMLQFNLAETSLDVFFQIRLTLVVILLVLLMSFNLAFFFCSSERAVPYSFYSICSR